MVSKYFSASLHLFEQHAEVAGKEGLSELILGDEVALVVFHDEFSLVEVVVGSQIETIGINLHETQWAGLASGEQLEVLAEVPVLLYEAISHQLLNIALLG
jgi:hypothetical protein